MPRDIDLKNSEEAVANLEVELRRLLDTAARDYAVAALAHVAAIETLLSLAANDRRLR